MATIEVVRKEFIEVYEKEYAAGLTQEQAYQKATEKMSSKYNVAAYTNFTSFSKSQFNRVKRELTKK